MAATAAETACTYACLLLHDDEIPISSENIVKVLNAANVKVDSYWPGLFAKLCEKKDVDELLLNTATSGAAVAAAPTAAAAAADSAPAAEEKKKEEVKEESEEETGLFDLFD